MTAKLMRQYTTAPPSTPKTQSYRPEDTPDNIIRQRIETVKTLGDLRVRHDALEA